MRLLALLLLAVAINAGEHNHPVGVTDGIASLDVSADGKMIHQLTAAAKPMSPMQIHYRRSDDSGSTWSTATIISTGMAPHKPNRTADIQIAAHGDQLLAAWSVAGTGFMGSGPLTTAISHDGGRSWSAGANPADDNSMGGHSFVDLAVDGSGRFHAAWLDNRSGKQGLIYSNSDDGGRSWAANRILDPTTCEYAVCPRKSGARTVPRQQSARHALIFFARSRCYIFPSHNRRRVQLEHTGLSPCWRRLNH